MGTLPVGSLPSSQLCILNEILAVNFRKKEKKKANLFVLSFAGSTLLSECNESPLVEQ